MISQIILRYTDVHLSILDNINNYRVIGQVRSGDSFQHSLRIGPRFFLLTIHSRYVHGYFLGIEIRDDSWALKSGMIVFDRSPAAPHETQSAKCGKRGRVVGPIFIISYINRYPYLSYLPKSGNLHSQSLSNPSKFLTDLQVGTSFLESIFLRTYPVTCNL